MKMEVYDFEPINYEEEFNNFCEVTALNISKFQKTNQDLDETVFNSDVVSNTNKLNEALKSLIDAKSQKEKILSNVSNDDVNIRDIQKDIAEILKRNEEASNNISQVNEAVAKKKQELSSKRNQTSSSKDIFEEKKSKIHLELEKWKKALGLELIISTHNSLIFKFSNIVRDDPEKTFTCEIKGRSHFSSTISLLIWYNTRSPSLSLRFWLK